MRLIRYLGIVFLTILITSCGKDEPPQQNRGDKGPFSSKKIDIKLIKQPKQMRHCIPCHTLKKGAKDKIGPKLFGVINRKVGSVSSYKYSKEYAEGDWLWTREKLDLLINKKHGTTPEAVRKLTGNPKARTKMKFYGAEDKDAQIILDYLEILN